MGEDGVIALPIPISNVSIGKDGTILVQPEGAPSSVQEEVGRIKLVAVDRKQVEKGTDGLYRHKDGDVLDADANIQLLAGSLEASNVNPVYEMTQMITLQRQFEMQVKMMKTAEENDSAASSLLRSF